MNRLSLILPLSLALLLTAKRGVSSFQAAVTLKPTRNDHERSTALFTAISGDQGPLELGPFQKIVQDDLQSTGGPGLYPNGTSLDYDEFVKHRTKEAGNYHNRSITLSIKVPQDHDLQVVQGSTQDGLELYPDGAFLDYEAFVEHRKRNESLHHVSNNSPDSGLQSTPKLPVRTGAASVIARPTSQSFKPMDGLPLIAVEDRPDSPEKSVDSFFVQQKKAAEKARIEAAVQAALANRANHNKSIKTASRRVSIDDLRAKLNKNHPLDHENRAENQIPSSGGSLSGLSGPLNNYQSGHVSAQSGDSEHSQAVFPTFPAAAPAPNDPTFALGDHHLSSKMSTSNGNYDYNPQQPTMMDTSIMAALLALETQAVVNGQWTEEELDSMMAKVDELRLAISKQQVLLREFSDAKEREFGNQETTATGTNRGELPPYYYTSASYYV